MILFSEDLHAGDPDLLRRLRTLLHGPAPAPRSLPDLEARFGMAAALGREATRAGPVPLSATLSAPRPIPAARPARRRVAA